jgi:hypothetical protein
MIPVQNRPLSVPVPLPENKVYCNWYRYRYNDIRFSKGCGSETVIKKSFESSTQLSSLKTLPLVTGTAIIVGIFDHVGNKFYRTGTIQKIWTYNDESSI